MLARMQSETLRADFPIWVPTRDPFGLNIFANIFQNKEKRKLALQKQRRSIFNKENTEYPTIDPLYYDLPP